MAIKQSTLDVNVPIQEEQSEPEPEDDELLDGDTRGRIKHHAQVGKLSHILWSINVSGPTLRKEVENTVGGTPEGMIEYADSDDQWTDIHGIGPAKAERLEATIPLIREALTKSHES